MLDVCHEARFADLPPAQIVPHLADEGTYLAPESSFYRILRAAQEQQHRGRARRRRAANRSDMWPTAPTRCGAGT